MWIPSHVGLVGNELVDERTRFASLNCAVFDAKKNFILNLNVFIDSF
jgi:hypothetical protein